MSKISKCDICGKTFDYGFLVDVKIQGGVSFANVAEDRFEIGQKDVCKECYNNIKKMLTHCCTNLK